MANYFDKFHGKKEPVAKEVSDSKVTIMTLNGDGSFKPMVLNDMPLIRGLKGEDGVDGNAGKDGRGIDKALLQGDTLYIRYDDGKTEKVGKIVGSDGIDGKNGVDGRDGINGIDGKDGADGRGITGAEINKDGELLLTFVDGVEENLGKVRGEDGATRVIGGGTNIGVGVMNAGALIGTGISLIDFTGAGISSITRTDRKVTISISGGGGGGSGDVVGPASATDNAVARFDGTTGKLIQNSAVTIADTSGNITGGTYNGNTIGAGSTSGTNTGDQTITLTGAVTGSGTGSFATTLGSNYLLSTIGFTIGGNGSPITTGKVTGFFTIPYAGTITGWSIVADTGTATVQTWKIATGTAKPTASNSISTAGVQLTTGTAIRSATVTDFTTTTVTANDIFAFNIPAISGATELTFNLQITRT